MKQITLICFIITQQITASSIIFDLGNVLIYPDRSQFIQQVGLGAIAQYSLHYNPIDLEQDFFAFLYDIMPISDQYCAWNNGKKLPHIITLWMKGTYSSEQVKKTINDHVHQYCNDDIQADMFLAIADAMFTPSQLAESLVLSADGIAFVRLCRMLGHTTYLLSNIDAETFKCITKKYPWFVRLFDDIAISGTEGCIKPDPRIYHRAIERFNIDPHDTVFIDDSVQNLEPAENLGIFTIICKQYKNGVNKKPYFNYVKDSMKLWWHAQFCKKYLDLQKQLNDLNQKYP